MSEFDRGTILTYQERGLTFRDITIYTVRNRMIIKRIWNQWIAEGHTELHARLQIPPKTTA